MSSASADDHYDDISIAFLRHLWGEGFMSPGGPEEVARVIGDLDLTGATVLDIGCGAGGPTVCLAADHDAGRVIGIDVEEPGRAAAQALVDRYHIDPERISVIGKGWDCPLDPDAPENHAQNRRIELVIYGGGD